MRSTFPALLWLLLPGFLGVGSCARSGGVRDLPLGAIRLANRAERDGGGDAPLTVHALGGALAAGYLFNRDESSSGARTTEHRMEQRLGVGAAGSVLSPEILVYDATGVVGYSQDWARARLPSDSSFDSGEFYEADTEANLFPLRWHPLNLYFTRTEEFEPRVLFSRAENRTTTAGANQQLALDHGNVNIGYLHRENKLTTFNQSARRTTLSDTTEDSVTLSGRYELTPRQNVRGRYVFRDVRQKPETSDFTDHRLDAEHRWIFGESAPHELRSRLDAELRDGLFEQERLRLDEHLRFHLTERLRAHTGLLLEIGTREELDRHQIRGEAGASHELYESVNTTATVQGGRTVDGESTIDSIGASGNLAYRKETPLGVLRANYSIGFERRHVEGGDGTVIDEGHTFPAVAPEEVILASLGIERQSLRVTDPTGTVLYRRGIDYTVTQDSSGRTILTRVFAGIIPVAGSILVDYRFQIGADFKQNTLSHRVLLEHLFDVGLRPYFEFRRQDQDLSDVEGGRRPVLLEEQSLIGGLEWSRSDYNLGVEYENRDSTLAPFEAVRLRAVGVLPVGMGHHLSASASQVWLFKDEPDREVSITNVNLGWRSSLARTLEFRSNGAFYYQDDNLAGVSKGASIWSELEYIWRKFSIRLRATYRDVQNNGSEFEGVEVSFWIVRELGTPPPSTKRVIRRMTQ